MQRYLVETYHIHMNLKRYKQPLVWRYLESKQPGIHTASHLGIQIFVLQIHIVYCT